MIFLLLPYALQLLCIIHIIRAHRSMYWLWIVIAVPYVGGLVYLAVELLPDLLSGKGIDQVRDTLADFIKPGEKFEIIKQKAMYSSTYKNMIEYADALMAKNMAAEALEIYTEQNKGAFLDDPELAYRIALALYKTGDYANALERLNALMKTSASFERKSRENLLRLMILEKTLDAAAVKAEYQKTLQRIQNNSIELPYIEFLIKTDDRDELKNIFEKIRGDEQSMRINRVRYDRNFYAAAYRLERSIPK